MVSSLVNGGDQGVVASITSGGRSSGLLGLLLCFTSAFSKGHMMTDGVVT